MLAIFTHTPVWVWLLLILLIYLGVTQSRDRQVSKNKAFILPIVMIVFSLHGVISSFGGSFDSLLFWGISFVATLLIGVLIFPPQQARFDESIQCFFIQGSWRPLFLILGIFTIKYTVGVMEGMQSPFLTLSFVVGGLSLLYGLCSGIFAARGLGLWRLSRTTQAYTSP
ncbi:hypothetical protein B6N13_07005 [Marinomonas sp. UCMA 3892]|uniref:DUF6622 family protein n=1 Tax=unclassified Marinomonas TaxID=196814 RepID=UPI00146A0D1B|nr:DUF6622 family protein [Marinomonas sp. UCMA 3892]NLU97850.1 hypothetical protein [Marinomonas sp. UCMA 3892]